MQPDFKGAAPHYSAGDCGGVIWECCSVFCGLFRFIRMEAVYLYLCLFPLNCILIGIKVIRQKIMEWGKIQRERAKRPERSADSETGIWNG